MSQKDICVKYDVHKSTVCRLLQKFKSTENVDIIHKGARPRLTTARTDYDCEASEKRSFYIFKCNSEGIECRYQVEPLEGVLSKLVYVHIGQQKSH